MNRRVPEGFTVVVQPPFVVIGDEPPAQVRLRATNTVKWAVDRLKLDYFKRDPAEIIDIWQGCIKARNPKEIRSPNLDARKATTCNSVRLHSDFGPSVFFRFSDFGFRICASGPTGFNTLKRVLSEDDMAAFQKKWEKFVLGLRQSDDL